MISGTFFYEPFYRLDVARNVFHNTLLRAHYENSLKKDFSVSSASKTTLFTNGQDQKKNGGVLAIKRS